MQGRFKPILAIAAPIAGCATQQAATPGAPAAVGRTDVPDSQEDLARNVGDRAFFDFDRSAIAGRGEPTRNNIATLDRQAAWLSKYEQNNIRIAGNCDERGTEEYNLALGNRRAETVRGYLIAKWVTAVRIQTIGYGKERPTAIGSNE